MLPRLLIPSLLVLAACAGTPDPVPDKANDAPPTAEDPVASNAIESEPEPERGRLVAADDEETKAGEALERAAQKYQDALEDMFAKLSTELDGCYLPQLKRDPNLAGTIVVEFTVVPGGGIGEGPRVSQTSLKNEKVEACLLELVRGQTYPEPFNGKYAKVLRTFRFGAF